MLLHHRYQSWSEAVGKATASVAVLYSSDYGYSDRLSQTLARGITKTGAATEMVDVLSVDAQVNSINRQRLLMSLCCAEQTAEWECIQYACGKTDLHTVFLRVQLDNN